MQIPSYAGGVLVVKDIGKLTSACQAYGKEYMLEACQTNPYLYQGMVSISNGGTIENAITAITCGLPDDYVAGGNGSALSGGIIRCHDGSFKNNQRDFSFKILLISIWWICTRL